MDSESIRAQQRAWAAKRMRERWKLFSAEEIEILHAAMKAEFAKEEGNGYTERGRVALGISYELGDAVASHA